MVRTHSVFSRRLLRFAPPQGLCYWTNVCRTTIACSGTDPLHDSKQYDADTKIERRSKGRDTQTRTDGSGNMLVSACHGCAALRLSGS